MRYWEGIVRVGRPWHRVPRAAVAVPGSLAVPKARLDIGALNSLGQWEGSLPWQGWHWMRFKVPSSPDQPGILCRTETQW